MKQLLQHARTGEISVTEVPAPQLLPGCVLVRVAASLVSAGTERAAAEFASKNLAQKAFARPDLVREVVSKLRRDGILSAMQAVRGRLDHPLSLGYSSAGTVLSVGQGVTDIRVGDRVACAGAGFALHAEVNCVPRLLLARIPDPSPISLEEAAFATVGAVALHGIRTAGANLGDLVAVIGLGLLGQVTTQLLKAAGCRVVGFDINLERAELASRLGADQAASSSAEFRDACFEQSRGMGVDAVLITAENPSSQPVNLAGEVCRDRAIVTAVGTVGMDIDRKIYYGKELDFRISRSYGPGRYDAAFEQKGRDYPIGYVRWTETRNMEAFVDLLAQGKLHLQSLITHRFPISDAELAYELITAKTASPFLGVVITYAEQPTNPIRTLNLVKRTTVELSTNSSVSIGLLGAGAFATSALLPAMTEVPGINLLGVCNATGARSRSAAEKFGFQYCTTDEKEILNDPRVSTVVIATRHHLHADQVLAALQAGKHVFCEKPLCLNEPDLARIVRAYTSSSPKPLLMVGFNRRFAPMAVRMKSFLSDLSEPLLLQYRVNAGFLSPDHWLNDPEQGGGRILGEVCHFVDFLMFLAGSAPVEVHARSLANPGQYSDDNVIVSLRFANGSQGTITYVANGDKSFSKERIEVFGGRAVAVLEDFRRLELVRHGNKQVLRSHWRQDKGHRGEWQAFADAIVQSSGAPIPFDQILAATLATLRVRQSISLGCTLTTDVAAFLSSALSSPTISDASLQRGTGNSC